MTGQWVPDEPALPVRPRESRFFQNPRFLRSFLPPAAVAVACVAVLLASGNVLLPFTPVVTLTGEVGSEKAAFFTDKQVQKILIAHHLKVDVTEAGSRDIATHGVGSFDFVLPSGRPSGQAIEDREQTEGKHYEVYRPFVSPLVLATYRQYADALVRAGVATEQGPGSYYYDLDVDKFVDLVRSGRTWQGIGLLSDNDRILAQTSDVCSSNSADSYLAIIAYAANHDGAVTDATQATAVARNIKPLLTAQGLPDAGTADRFQLYLTPDGIGHGPVIAVYEHQYLAYQAQQTLSGHPDTTRVLLYPTTSFVTQPEFIALDPAAAELGRLLTTDSALQRRATELGFRLANPSDLTLTQYLRQIGMPAPGGDSDHNVNLPNPKLLDQMIDIVGDCAS